MSPVSNALWTKVQSELGMADATLATLLSCSVEEVVKWRAGDEGRRVRRSGWRWMS